MFLRRKAVWVWLYVFFGLFPGILNAAAFDVTSNSDGGPGSLRQAVLSANASSGRDQIYISDAVGPIVLETGQLVITESVLIEGRSGAQIVSGNHLSRVLYSSNAGATVELIGLIIKNGRIEPGYEENLGCRDGNSYNGAGICSAGELILNNVEVSDNEIQAGSDGIVFGAGIFSLGPIDATNSSILRNVAEGSSLNGCGIGADAAISLTSTRVSFNHCSASSWVSGIGVNSLTSVTLENSSVDNNTAESERVRGGGIALSSSSGSLVLSNSTVSRNSSFATSEATGTGFYMRSYPSIGSVQIIQSTVSENISDAPLAWGVAARITNANVSILNSTIYANEGASNQPGVRFSGFGENYNLEIVSSIIAGNRSLLPNVEGEVYDLEINNRNVPMSREATNSYLGNLSQELSFAQNNIHGSRPDLLHLAEQGCSIEAGASNSKLCIAVHEPVAGSPVLDTGLNRDSLAFDTRGSGFDRTVGIATDIGAVESQNDLIDSLQASPKSLEFGYTPSGASSDPLVVQVANSGFNNIQLGGVSSNSAIFRIVGNSCSGSLSPGATCTVSVIFEPTEQLDATATLRINEVNQRFVLVIPMSGVGFAENELHVTSSQDAGSGSFRRAAKVSNAMSGEQTITFANNLPLITLTSETVVLTDDVSIVGPAGDLQEMECQRIRCLTSWQSEISLRLENIQMKNSGSPRGGSFGNSCTRFDGSGGAICTRGDFSARNVSFQNNAAQGWSAEGGALYIGGNLIFQGAIIGSIARSRGGAVYASGSVDISASVISSNQTGSNIGGAVYGGGNISVKNSILRGNVSTSTQASGVAIYGNNVISLWNSTISDNYAAADNSKGVIYNCCGIIVIRQSTIVDNDIGGQAAAAYSGGNLRIENSTITGNRAATGAAIEVGGNATIESTIIVANDGPAGNIDVDSAGTLHVNSSIFGDSLNEVTGDATDVIWSNSVSLSPLADYGCGEAAGSILAQECPYTIMPNESSMAIDAGIVNGLLGEYDQRGEGFPRVIGYGPDIGAVEVNTPPPELIVTTVSDAGVGSLREVVALANAWAGPNTVNFLEGLGEIALSTGSIEITDELAVIGNAPRQSINALGLSRVFFVPRAGTPLRLRNLELRNGAAAGPGGAILSESPLFIESSEVASSMATQEGGGLSANSVTIFDSVFNGNQTQGDNGFGGAIYSGDAHIASSQFIGNRTRGLSSRGGAIYVRSPSQSTIADSLFQQNRTEGHGSKGGAIYSRSALLVENSRFEGNWTENDSSGGGAVYAKRGLVVSNSEFWGNFTVGQLSGGAAIRYDDDILPLTALDVTDSEFDGNETRGDTSYGGAIYAKEAQLSGLLVSNNRTLGIDSNGGALAADRFISLDNSEIVGNKILGDFTNGGAIYSPGVVTITNSLITDNQAEGASSLGGAIFSDVADISEMTELRRNKILLSGTGGAIHASDVVLTDVLVDANTAPGRGGGILSRGDFTASRVTISANQTSGDEGEGGGVFAIRNATVSDCKISLNRTLGQNAGGAGIYALGGLVARNCRFNDNRTLGSGSNGGGIYSQGEIDIRNSSLMRNHTEGESSDGGALYSSGRLTIFNSTLGENTALGQNSRGGAIASRFTSELVYVTLVKNQANSGGAAFDINNVFDGTLTLTVSSSVMADNSGPGGSFDRNDASNGPIDLVMFRSLFGDSRAEVTSAFQNMLYSNEHGLLPAADNGCYQEAGFPTERSCTLSYLPGDSSPVLDAAVNGPQTITDQRGPGFARISLPAPDMGAVEHQGISYSIGPSPLDFGEYEAGSNVPSRSISINNQGEALTITESFQFEFPFFRSGGTCPAPPFELFLGDECTLEISVVASSVGDFQRELPIFASDITLSVTILADPNSIFIDSFEGQ